MARVCPAFSGSVLTFEYRDVPDDASKGSIDISHKGPCAVYMKKTSSAISDTAVGGGWFKVWEEGYDEAARKWCTEKIIDNDGHMSIVIPSALEAGYYLIRPELLALHQTDKTPSDPQFYVGCAQLFLSSPGDAAPQDTVKIPGYVRAGEPSVSFNIWREPMALPYPMPGPPIYFSNTKRNIAQHSSQLFQTEGMIPAKCVLQNANWCGIELDKYSTETGCWNASAACWKRCDECYNSAPPTGSVNCPIREAKCTAIQQECNAGNFNGPPNHMKALTPAMRTVVLPKPNAPQVGDGSYLPTTGIAASGSVTTEQASAPSTTCTTTCTTTSPSVNSVAKLAISEDGSCNNDTTCQGSNFGSCCSSNNWCGSSAEYCGDGCQSAYGTCGTAATDKRRVHEASSHAAQAWTQGTDASSGR